MKQSAGILLYRLKNEVPEFFLVHPGGPFFTQKNEGWWTIPKGEVMDDEDPFTAAKREFKEETGYEVSGEFTALMPVKQKAGKIVSCWAVEGDFDQNEVKSNTFEIEWPPKSGQRKSFPEIDRAGWFAFEEAQQLINEAQRSFLIETLKFLT